MQIRIHNPVMNVVKSPAVSCISCSEEAELLAEKLCSMLRPGSSPSCRLEQLLLPAITGPKLSAALRAVWEESWGQAARLSSDLAGSLLLSVS